MVSDLDGTGLPARRVANVAAGMLSLMFVFVSWEDLILRLLYCVGKCEDVNC